MKHPKTKTTHLKKEPTSHLSGMTLIELTVVVVVIMSMVGLLFTGARAWKEGANRSNCILNQSQVQKAMRSHAHMYGYDVGQTIFNLPNKLIGPGSYIDSTPICPRLGTYTFGAEYGQDTVPPYGTIYMTCSHALQHDHEPSEYSNW